MGNRFSETILSDMNIWKRNYEIWYLFGRQFQNANIESSQRIESAKNSISQQKTNSENNARDEVKYDR